MTTSDSSGAWGIAFLVLAILLICAVLGWLEAQHERQNERQKRQEQQQLEQEVREANTQIAALVTPPAEPEPSQQPEQPAQPEPDELPIRIGTDWFTAAQARRFHALRAHVGE